MLRDEPTFSLASSFGLFGHCYLVANRLTSLKRSLASSFGLFGHCYKVDSRQETRHHFLHRHLVCSVTVTSHEGSIGREDCRLASSFGLFGHCYRFARSWAQVATQPCIVIWFVRSLLRTGNPSDRRLFPPCIVIWFVRSLLLDDAGYVLRWIRACIVIWFVRSLLLSG